MLAYLILLVIQSFWVFIFSAYLILLAGCRFRYRCLSALSPVAATAVLADCVSAHFTTIGILDDRMRG